MTMCTYPSLFLTSLYAISGLFTENTVDIKKIIYCINSILLFYF